MNAGYGYIDGYINQLYEKVIELLYPQIIDVYTDEILQGEDDINQLLKKNVNEVMIKYGIIVPEDDKYATFPAMRQPSSKKIESLRKKRLYWVKNICDDYAQEKSYYMEGDPAGSKPQTTSLTPYCFINFELKKGEKNLEDLCEEYDSKFTYWLNCTKNRKFKNPEQKAYFCDYPYIRFYPKEAKKNFYEIDLENNVLYIMQNYDLFNFARMKPMPVVKSGMFRESGKRNTQLTYDFNKDDVEKYMATFMTKIDRMEKNTPYLENFSTFLMDERGAELLTYLVTRCYRSYYQYGQARADGNFGELVRVIYPKVKKPSQKHYVYTKTYYINLGYLAILVKKDNGGVSRNPIFDDVDFDPRKDVNEDLYYSVSLSSMFTRNIISLNVSTIITSTYNRLEGDIAKLLYQDLKVDRLHDLMNSNNREDVQHIYTISMLQFVARVTGRKVQRRNKYKNAIQELKEKCILVKEVDDLEDGFQITWLPLSETEHEDVMLRRIDVIDMENLLESTEIVGGKEFLSAGRAALEIEN
ncbi:hypothetical protein QMP26_41870 (plasmid) [Enterocloster clostridioformis]